MAAHCGESATGGSRKRCEREAQAVAALQRFRVRRRLRLRRAGGTAFSSVDVDATANGMPVVAPAPISTVAGSPAVVASQQAALATNSKPAQSTGRHSRGE